MYKIKEIHKSTLVSRGCASIWVCALNQTYTVFFFFFSDDVAVIDEIQMLRDPSRSWAWTRALLGIAAEEVHVCGEKSAMDYVKELVESIGDLFEYMEYRRLTTLTVARKGIGECITYQLWEMVKLVKVANHLADG